MRKIRIFLVLGLCLLLGNAAANAQTCVGISMPVSDTNGITSGMYIINVWAKGSQGLLYERAATGYTGFVSTNTINNYLGQAIDTSNAEMQKMLWNLVRQDDGSFTIQSASTSKYFSKRGHRGVGIGDVQRVSNNTDSNIGHLALNTKVNISSVPFFSVRLENGKFNGGNSTTFFHVNGGGTGTADGNMHLSYWESENTSLSNTASGVLLSFYKVEEIQNPVNFDYVYRVDGLEIYRQSKTVSEGSVYPDLASAPAFCEATKPEGTVSTDLEGKEVNIDVTWSAPVAFSTSPENAKWYLMTAGRDNDANPKVLPVMRYTEGQNYITLKTADKDFSLSSADQWAFVGNPYEGFKIYNRFNQGRLISSTALTSSNDGNTNPYVSTGELPSGYTELWDLQAQQKGGSPSTIDGGFSISQHGQPSYKMNKRSYRNQASDPRLAYWISGADNGSTFTATQTLPSSLVTYNAFESNGYTTLYVDYPIAVTNAKVYTGQRNDAQTSVEMTLATDNIIPANTGVVLVRDGSNVDQTYTISNEPGTVEPGDISGTTTAITLTDETRNNYRVFGLSNASPQSLGFFRPSSRVPSIPANKAFYDLTGSGVQGFVLSFDGMETGIALEQIMQPRPEAHEPAYDLSGRRVNHAAKGIYIIGGKKVIVK